MHRPQWSAVKSVMRPAMTRSQTHNFLAIEIKDTKVAEMLEKEFRVLLLNRINNHIEDSEAEGWDKKSFQKLD